MFAKNCCYIFLRSWGGTKKNHYISTFSILKIKKSKLELVNKTKKALEGEDTDEIKKTSEELSNKVMEVSSRIYQEQAAESQKQSENASHEEESEEKESKKDNVKDAEFEEK